MNSQASRIMPLSDTPASALMTNSSMPKGGVTSPIIMLTASTTPRWTRSTPSSLAVGSKMGTSTSSMMEVSRKQPSTRNSTLTSSKKPSGDSSMPVSHAATRPGTFSAVKA